MSDTNQTAFQERVDDVYARIDAACAGVSRAPSDVTLVAVSKTFPPEAVDAALRAGLSVFGESKVQEAVAKARLCGRAEWHFIGRLQRNKVRAALGLFSTIHSVDTIALLDEISRVQEETGQRPNLMLEVNTGSELTKIGFSTETVRHAVERVLELGNLNLTGLMTIPPWAPNAEQTRPYFAKLRTLRDALETEFGIGLPNLSMGMSADFDVAIEEGATYVRVGTTLFGARGAWKPNMPQRSLDTDDFV